MAAVICLSYVIYCNHITEMTSESLRCRGISDPVRHGYRDVTQYVLVDIPIIIQFGIILQH